MTIDRRSFLTGAASAAMAIKSSSLAQAQAAAPAKAPDELSYRSVGELRAMLDGKKISASELLEHAITRIEKYDGKINAVVVRDFDRSRSVAKDADQALARGERRPLLGIPMTVKESFNVAGLPTSWGLPMGRDWRPTEDAVPVARLKAAGAVILGKTNLAIAIADWQSFNPIYGVTRNPWNLERTPGGSSGGGAAAIAAGFAPLELGSDLSASMRVPAHFCGVFCHKPTSDIVPQRGHAPPRAAPLQTDLTSGLGVCGPIARNVTDLTTAFDLLAGPDSDQAAGYQLTLTSARHINLRSYRVLVLDDHPLLPVENDIRAMLDRLAGLLAAAGAKVARASPLLPDLSASARLHTRMIRNFTAFGQPPQFFQGIREQLATLPGDDTSLKAERLRAPLLSHHEWMAAEIERARLRLQWNALFKEFDVVLCPPCAVTAFPHDHAENMEQRSIAIDGARHPYPSLIVWATLATPPGLPATIMPAGLSKDGLPIGVQIIGPQYGDRTTLGFAGLLERQFGGFVPPPMTA